MWMNYTIVLFMKEVCINVRRYSKDKITMKCPYEILVHPDGGVKTKGSSIPRVTSKYAYANSWSWAWLKKIPEIGIHSGMDTLNSAFYNIITYY